MSTPFTIPLLAWAFIAAPAFGQSYHERFSEQARSRDLQGQRAVLQQWTASDSSDAELYVAWFNHYFQAAKRGGIMIGNEPGREPFLQINDPDSTATEPVGYIYDGEVFDPVVIDSGFMYIEKGIAMYPQRLDMRYGKIYALGQVEDYDRFTDEVVRTIEHGAQTNYRWTWTNNEPVEEPLEFMLDGVQQYVYQLFDTGDSTLIAHMGRISRTVLEYQPDNVPSLSNLGSLYLMNGQYDEALEQFLHAEKLAPTDDIVTGNIAEAYKRMGDITSAIKYYERTYELGGADTKDFAKEQIEALKK